MLQVEYTKNIIRVICKLICITSFFFFYIFLYILLFWRTFILKTKMTRISYKSHKKKTFLKAKFLWNWIIFRFLFLTFTNIITEKKTYGDKKVLFTLVHFLTQPLKIDRSLLQPIILVSADIFFLLKHYCDKTSYIHWWFIIL